MVIQDQRIWVFHQIEPAQIRFNYLPVRCILELKERKEPVEKELT